MHGMIETRQGGAETKVGQTATLEQAYDQHASALFRYARALLGSVDDAEDAVQEVFVRLARDVSRLPGIRDLRHYLLRATRNAVYEIVRSKGRRGRLVEGAALNMQTTSADPEVEQLLEAFAELPTEQREVVALKVFQGLTFREIAKVIGKPENTAASRYRYAIERLRALMRES
jgi:RNA polymerase sigma-70 factor, ECF subfamily